MAEVTTESVYTKPATHHAASSRKQSATRKGGKQRVLIVGAGARGQDIARELSARNGAKFDVIGFVDDVTDYPGLNGLRVLGCFNEVLKVAQDHAVDEVIVAYMPNWQEELVKRAMACEAACSLQIKVLPGFYDAMVSECQIERIEDIPLVRLTGNRPGRLFMIVKRVFDLLFSLLMLIICLPVLAVAALAVKLASSGPAFFYQERVGRSGRIFRIRKLRTMIVDAERGTGPILAHENDSRITAVGRFLRQTRIDEIPQFWNVLLGEMSIVGPRPERPEFGAEFAARIPGYAERYKVRPGVTGLAQVYGDYLTSVYHKLRYDWLYIHRMSVLLDLRILLLTIGTVLSRKGT